MKTYLLPVIAAALLFGSCKEKAPAVDLGTTPVARDTTYISSKTEAPDKKVVLIEEFTGVSCPPCPKFRLLLENVGAQHPGQLAVMELHFEGHIMCQPIHNYSKYDFRTVDANDIAVGLYGGIGNIPVAGFDRALLNNSRIQDPMSWANAVEQRLQDVPPANIKIKSTYDPSSKNATIVVTVTYTKTVAEKQFLSVALLEGGIIDAQKMFPEGIEKNYEFKHTFRDMITDIKGDEFLRDIPTKEVGRVYERTFIYPVDGNWKPENCVVAAFVHNFDGDDKEILQAAEADLKGQ